MVGVSDTVYARRAAAQILVTLQAPDGALPMGTASDTRRRVVPYFANLGVLGLVVAASVEADGTRRQSWLTAARRWVAWYDQYRNSDGTVYDYEGQPGAWKSTGKYDSTDSYASTYLEVVAALERAEPTPNRRRNGWDFVQKSVAAILLTRQPNGLTTATPTWPFMYTMDTVEVLRGLKAAVRLSETHGSRADTAHWMERAHQAETGLARILWNKQDSCYLVGVHTDGTRSGGLSQWYPDLMANLMAIGWLPATQPRIQLYHRLAYRFATTLEAGYPQVARTENDLERLVWWGYAARTAGDMARFARIQTTLLSANLQQIGLTNPAIAGHICRLLSPAEAVHA